MRRVAKSIFCVLGIALLLSDECVAPSKAFAHDNPQADDDGLIKAYMQQFAPVFDQLYRSELHYLRLVTQPTKAQFEQIAASSRPAVNSANRDFARTVRSAKLQQRQANSTPQSTLTNAIAASAATVLSPQQMQNLRRELEQRQAARKRTILASLVNRLDTALYLSAEQRAQLTTILNERWNESMNFTTPFLPDQQLPPLPEKDIAQILTETQKSIWQHLPRGIVGIGFDSAYLRQVDFGEESWDDGVNKDGAKAATKDGPGTAAPDRRNKR